MPELASEVALSFSPADVKSVAVWCFSFHASAAIYFAGHCLGCCPHREALLDSIEWGESRANLANCQIIHDVKKGEDPEGSPPHFERLSNLERDPHAIITSLAYWTPLLLG